MLAINKVQNAILAKGYITTRVMAEEQDLTKGVLTLTLQPGRIGDIRFDEPVSWRGRLWNAIPASRGDILNLRDIEQGLENFRRVPSVNADIKIVPGEHEATSDLQVNWHEGRPVRLSLRLDDSGSKSTGRYLGSATLAVDAPFAQNDLFYGNIGKDLFQHGPFGNRSHALNYFFPLGYWAFSANYNDYTYHQHIPNANEVLSYSGKSDNIQLTVSRLLYRDQSHKTTLNLRGYRKHSTNHVDDVELTQQKRRTAGWELGLNQSSYFGTTTLDANISWRRGTGALGALRAPEEVNHDGSARTGMLLGDAAINIPFALGEQPWRVYTSMLGQWSPNALTPQERMAIAGRYTVRGFDGEQMLSGEKGLLWRNEIAWNVFSRGHELYLAADYGRVKAGKDLSFDAARDISLQSAQNTESTVGKNSSKGGNVGVGIGAGSGGYGISVSAGVNAGKGHENGNGLTHTETTLDAGNHLSLTSGRDTTLKGAQASGEKVTVDVGRDLRLESEQDSDRYDAKQQNVSAGGSFTFGSMTGSANVSASQDKLKSNFDSVKEQTGLFAGKGGYDVKVKEHTQLDGAVITSSADKEKNRLDTGTLGWSDIYNQADYKAEPSGGSLSTGGPVGKDLLTNMGGGMLSGANNSGHAEGTTKAGVSEGTLIVRNGDKQQQDVAQLNRDTDHANDGSISPIFNKDKEQNRLKQAQLIGEIGSQAMDVIRTQGEIAGLKAQKEPGALAQAREELTKDGKPASDADVMQRAYDNAMQQYGTGSDLQKAAQAVTALAGNNLAGALASGASPYLATEIKKLTTNPLTGAVDVAANAMAHAVLGAVTAQLNNQSAAAGGLGAGGR